MMNGNLSLLHIAKVEFQFTIEETEILLAEIELITKMLMLQMQLYIRKNVEWEEIPIEFDIGDKIYRWKLIRGEETDGETKIRKRMVRTLERKTEEVAEEIALKETLARIFQKEFLFILLTEGSNK